jgi:hypothetical protein
MLLLLLACTPAKDRGTDETADTAIDQGPPVWDAAAPAIDCAPGTAAPLLDAALADAELDREDFGYTDRQWNQWGAMVDNPFVLSWFLDVHHAPEQVPCFAGQLNADLDVLANTPHPVAGLIGAMAVRADYPLTLDPVDPAGRSLADAVTLLLDVTGDDADLSVLDALDAELSDALVPVVLAIADAVAARQDVDAAADAAGFGASKLHGYGAGMVIGLSRVLPDPRDAEEMSAFADWHLSAEGPRVLADHARRIAFAIEDADLTRFAGGWAELRIDTSAGALIVSPGSDDVHPDEAVLLQVELGGADQYLGGAGATRDEDNPVSVVIDLGGDDRYGYEVVADPSDEDALPSDAAGRAGGDYPTSESSTGRQGSGRYGVGLLYDLGASADRYESLRMSQGFGSLGVGVLADDGGDDAYVGEAGVQGAGVYGLGLLYDGGGTDSYTAWAYAQGFAYVGSGGLAYDRDGADTWYSDPGNNYGGKTLYRSAQLANGEANSSFTQGAGFGFRGDSYGLWLAGGLGVLRDAAGDDAYTGGVFTQATGYWEGTGVLADAGGNDTYDALYYTQAGAAHYALAIFVEGGGDDRYNPTFRPLNVMLGSGHDYSVGVLIDQGGDDTNRSTSLSMGSSNCQGIGVFVDNEGSDTYQAESSYGYGLGNHSGECATRTNAQSEGIFMDAGGTADTYVWPEGDARAPADDSTFGVAWDGGSDEKGGAVDGAGGAAASGFAVYGAPEVLDR